VPARGNRHPVADHHSRPGMRAGINRSSRDTSTHAPTGGRYGPLCVSRAGRGHPPLLRPAGPRRGLAARRRGGQSVAPRPGCPHRGCCGSVGQQRHDPVDDDRPARHPLVPPPVEQGLVHEVEAGGTRPIPCPLPGDQPRRSRAVPARTAPQGRPRLTRDLAGQVPHRHEHAEHRGKTHQDADHGQRGTSTWAAPLSPFAAKQEHQADTHGARRNNPADHAVIPPRSRLPGGVLSLPRREGVACTRAPRRADIEATAAT
jgi:hypothetical protein